MKFWLNFKAHRQSIEVPLSKSKLKSTLEWDCCYIIVTHSTSYQSIHIDRYIYYSNFYCNALRTKHVILCKCIPTHTQNRTQCEIELPLRLSYLSFKAFFFKLIFGEGLGVSLVSKPMSDFASTFNNYHLNIFHGCVSIQFGKVCCRDKIIKQAECTSL